MSYKRAGIILLVTFLIVYIVLIATAFSNIESVIQTSAALDPNGFTIIVDAGHGGEDGGAVANGITEKDINLSIALRLSDVLRLNGYNVVTTRDKDEMLSTVKGTTRERKVSDMKKRLELFDTENSIVISIHQNKFPQEKYHGAQVFYGQKNPDSSVLAEAVRADIVKLIQPDNTRECKKADDNIFLLKNCVNPAVIIECGFISNFEEAKLLSDESYQNKLVFSIFSGILKYTSNRGAFNG